MKDGLGNKALDCLLDWIASSNLRHGHIHSSLVTVVLEVMLR